MKNSNKGASASAVSKSESESATNAGFKGSNFDPKVVTESLKGHDRNAGSPLRAGSNRKSSHDSGNRYGK